MISHRLKTLLAATATLATLTALGAPSAFAVYSYYDASSSRTVFSSALQAPGLYSTGSIGIGVTATTALDVSGVFNFRGMAAPAVSAAGSGRIYFDSSANVFKVSEHGGAYAGIGGMGGSGNATYIPRFSASTTLQNANLNDTGTNVGIGIANPTSFKLQVTGSIGPNAAPTIGSVSQTTTQISIWPIDHLKITIGSDGFPVLSHYNSDNLDLLVTKCGNIACSAGNTTTSVDTTGDVGKYNSVAIGVDTYPIVAYYDASNGDLKIAKCGNTACSSGNTITTVDSTGDVGQFTSITIGSDGNPIISYHLTNTSLKIIKCGNTGCTTGNTITTIGGTSPGTYTWIASGKDGLPSILYFYSGVRLLKCGNLACSSGNVDTVVNASGNYYGGLVIGKDGLPFLAYYGPSSYLYGTKCGDVSCTSGNTTTQITSSTNGYFIGISIGTEGFPVISSGSSANGYSQLTKCGNIACSSGNSTTDIASQGWYGTAVAVGMDGFPTVAMGVTNPNYLTVTKCATPSCSQTTGSSLSSGSDLGSRSLYFKNAYAAQYWGRQFQVADFADVAENYASDEPLSPGTLVAVSPSLPIRSDGVVTPLVRLTSSPYDPQTLGVVSTNPAIILSSESGNTPIALAGRVPVRVSTENGPIMIGDPITSSSTPGVGMRATRAGKIIGVALETFDGAGEGSILVAVQIGELPNPTAQGSDSVLSSLLDRTRSLLSLLGFGEGGALSAERVEAERGNFDRLRLIDRATGEAYCLQTIRGILSLPSRCTP